MHLISDGFDLLEVVSGSLEIINNTRIHDLSGLFNLLMTNLVMRDSVIERMSFRKSPIRATASVLELHDIILTDINDTSDKEIILINDESVFLVNNLTYQNSNTKLVRALAGEMSLSNLEIRNISNFSSLVHIYSLEKVALKSLTFSDLQPSSDQIILVANSQNVSFDSFRISNSNATAISIVSSHVESMTQVHVLS